MRGTMVRLALRFAAAGAVEAIAAILALKNDIVPPTINHFTDTEM